MAFRMKGSSGLSIVDRSLESPLGNQDGYLTPNDRFFVGALSISPGAAWGRHTLMTRATDRHSRTQPVSVPFNDSRYLLNAIHPQSVTVE